MVFFILVFVVGLVVYIQTDAATTDEPVVRSDVLLVVEAILVHNGDKWASLESLE